MLPQASLSPLAEPPGACCPSLPPPSEHSPCPPTQELMAPDRQVLECYCRERWESFLLGLWLRKIGPQPGDWGAKVPGEGGPTGQGMRE